MLFSSILIWEYHSYKIDERPVLII